MNFAVYKESFQIADVYYRKLVLYLQRYSNEHYIGFNKIRYEPFAIS